MDWTQIINSIVGFVIGGGFIGGVINWRKSKPETEGLAIKNLQMVIETMHKDSETYRKRMEERVCNLESKIDELSFSDNIKTKAINQWITCKYIKEAQECPVSEFMDEAEKEIDERIEEIHNKNKQQL